ncbi:MAG TPA: hypothetical protein ENK18_02470 [Deltaproteobacteria bacterium]|nr:hypothetical protein [Deltaproteobacteria bacterium]
MYLLSRGSEYAIHVDERRLMTNRGHGSEDALADLACDRLARLNDARILVGGLGMGFTLAAALRRVGPAGRVVVAELVPAVVRWNRGHVGRAARHPLQDPRAEVYIGNVCDLVEASSASYSAILLDVDNGPRMLTRPSNGWLYTRGGIEAARAALIPGGILGIWSAAIDGSLTRRLRKAGLAVEVLRYTEEGRPTPDDSGTQVLWMARRP